MGWVIDQAHSTIGFSARHMGLSTVRGRFTKFEGTIEGDPDDITTAKARLEIDLASVDTGNADRDAHLRSADFFTVEEHPKMIFESTSVERKDEDIYLVRGNLTINGVTKDVELEYEHGGRATDPFGNDKIGGTLTGQMKRSDWGLKWNVAVEAGGFLVSDKIKLEIDFQVARSQDAVEEEVELEAQSV